MCTNIAIMLVPMTDSPKLRANYAVTKIGRLNIDSSKLLDYMQWEQLGPEAIFNAAWDLVVESHKTQGKDLNELRLQRSVVNIYRK